MGERRKKEGKKVKKGEKWLAYYPFCWYYYGGDELSPLTERNKMRVYTNEITESLKKSGKSLFKDITCTWNDIEKAYEVDITAQGLDGSKQAARVLILPLTGQMTISYRDKQSTNKDHAMLTYMIQGHLKKWHARNAQKICESFSSILEVE